MNCVPPRVTSAPSVPPQQNRLLPLVVVPLTLPPELPSSMAPDCPFCFPGTTVTTAEPDAGRSACDTAVTRTVVVVTSPEPSGVVGTPPGATYKPEPEMKPAVRLPPVTPFTCHVTPVLAVPETDTANSCGVYIFTH